MWETRRRRQDSYEYFYGMAIEQCSAGLRTPGRAELGDGGYMEG